MSKYSDNMDTELQQRAVEYVTIFSKYDQMRYVHKGEREEREREREREEREKRERENIYLVIISIARCRGGIFERMPKVSSKTGGSSTNLEGAPVITANGIEEPKQTDSLSQVRNSNSFVVMQVYIHTFIHIHVSVKLIVIV